MNVATVATQPKPTRSISLRPTHLADPLLSTKITIGPVPIAA